eukprot:gene10362-8301_t
MSKPASTANGPKDRLIAEVSVLREIGWLFVHNSADSGENHGENHGITRAERSALACKPPSAQSRTVPPRTFVPVHRRPELDRLQQGAGSGILDVILPPTSGTPKSPAAVELGDAKAFTVLSSATVTNTVGG